MSTPIKPDDPRVLKGLAALAASTDPIADAISKTERDKPYYYNPDTAEKVKEWLGKVHSSKKTLFIQGVTATIRMKYYHGARYLVDHYPNEYEDIVKMTLCRPAQGGAELHLRKVPRDFKAWKKFSRADLAEYLINAEKGDKYHMMTLLSPEDMLWIDDTLSKLSSFVYQVTETEIKVIKME